MAAASRGGALGEPRLVAGEAGVRTLLRAALPSLPVIGSLPGVRKAGGGFEGLAVTREPVEVERGRVSAYAEVCGFPEKDTVPVTYPHMLAFPLHMAILSDPAFPAPAIGTVHIENSLTSLRPIAVGETLGVTVSVGSPLPHPVGTAYRFATTVTSRDPGGRDEVVWESVSTYLRRGRRNPDAAWTSTLEDVPPSGPVFPLPADLGRRYAGVSGDYNPIHLTPITAKALGFPRQIAHGMWTKARCLAALENRLPDAVRVDVAFKKPVFLPSSVAFGARPATTGDGYAFSLHKRGSDTLHLLGRTRAV